MPLPSGDPGALAQAVMAFKRELFSYVDTKFAAIDSRMTAMEQRFTELEAEVRSKRDDGSSSGELVLASDKSGGESSLLTDMRQLMKQLREL